MPQTLTNIRMDEELKRNMEQTCQELGMKMTTDSSRISLGTAGK